MLNYTTYVQRIADLTVIASTSASVDFSTFINGTIEYAEGRIYRELDMMETRFGFSGILTQYTRTVAVSTATDIRVIDAFYVYTPVGTFLTASQLTPVSFEFLNSVYPTVNSSTQSGFPEYFARNAAANVILAPTPDDVYGYAYVGTFRPEQLSVSNTSTILTQLIPEVFTAASMIYASGYMRDFGGATDNPQQSASWEAEYQKLMQSAGVQEFRRKFQSQAWTAQQPNSVATPPRV